MTTTAAATVATAKRGSVASTHPPKAATARKATMSKASNNAAMSKAKAAAAEHVSATAAATLESSAIRERSATATMAAIQAILPLAAKAATGDGDERETFLAFALTAYKALEAWPVNDKGEKVGEKAAGNAGKAYVALRVMTIDRFTQEMVQRTPEQMTAYRSERAKAAVERHKGEAAAQLKAEMAKQGVIPMTAVTAELAFDLFIKCYDSVDAAAAAFKSMATARKASDKAAAAAERAKLVGDKAAAAAPAAATARKAAAERQKKATAREAAANAKTPRVARNNARKAAAAAIDADNARTERNNVAAAAATLQ